MGRVTDRLVQRATRLRRDPLVGLPRVACDFLGVLDGRTLHAHILLPAGPEPEAERADLLFARGRRVLRWPTTIRRDDAGRLSAEVLTHLGDEAGEIPLTKGTWSLGLAVSAAGRAERRFALRTDAPADRGGPIVQTPPHPVSGWRYEPVRSAQGLGQITVAEINACAEVVELVTGRAEARIRARFVGVPSLDAPAVVFTPRGGGRDLIVPIAPVGGRFELVVPLADLASGPPGAEVIWDAWVRIAPTRMVRLGRFLHDLRDPHTVLRVSRVTIPLDADQFVGYRPYCTGAGNLAVACIRFARFTGTQR